MEHNKLSSRTANNIIKTANDLIDTLNEANNELQEDLIHLQLAQTGVEEKDWMRHPEHLDRDIKETQEAIQYVFEMSKQLERLIQLTTK